MYSGMRDFDAYARTIRRTYWARELEQMAQAVVDPLRATVLVGELTAERVAMPAGDRALQTGLAATR